MTRRIIVALLVVCVLGCLVGCSSDVQKTSQAKQSEKKVVKSTATIGCLEVSRIYEQPQDQDLVHIRLHGKITNVEFDFQGNFTLEPVFQEIGSKNEIPGSGEASHIFIGDTNPLIVNNAYDTELLFREFDITLYEPLDVQKQAGKQFRLIVYLKQVTNLETNERVILQRIPTTFVFTASPLQPYQIQ